MFDSTCLFCKIIQGHIPSTTIDENDYVKVIKDINPRAPVHYLIVPKVHYANLVDMKDEHEVYLWQIMKMAQKLSTTLTGAQAFNLVCNNGKESGQVIFHQHFHFTAGRNIHEEGLKL